MLCEWFAFGVNKPTLSYFFIPLVLGPLNSLVWLEVPLGDIALGCFLFLQEQIRDIIIKDTESGNVLPWEHIVNEAERLRRASEDATTKDNDYGEQK